MAWFTEPLEINKDGQHTGRWRLTATSDEDGGGPYGDISHDHDSPDEAIECEYCQDFVAGITGFPSEKQRKAQLEAVERAELARLKNKYETPLVEVLL